MTVEAASTFAHFCEVTAWSREPARLSSSIYSFLQTFLLHISHIFSRDLLLTTIHVTYSTFFALLLAISFYSFSSHTQHFNAFPAWKCKLSSILGFLLLFNAKLDATIAHFSLFKD